MTAMIRRHRDRRISLSLSRRERAGVRASRGFTLIELLVVMGIIAVLGAITTLSYRGISRDAKLSSGKNTVSAVLDNARGLAMKNNRIVLVVFRPRLEEYNKQRVEAVICQWTGESAILSNNVVDRFAPIPGVPSRLLPEGIKVAVPFYGNNDDNRWITQSHLPRINQSSGLGEPPGEIVGVMYAPDGATITRNTATDSHRVFVDFNNNGAHDWGFVPPTYTPANFNLYFSHYLSDDECWVDIAPFLAVFNDDQVRELYDVNNWTDIDARIDDYSEYINNNVDPIYFNRYTGVTMK